MKKTALLFITVICILQVFSQKTGIFENHEDVGNPKNSGSVVYNTYTQEYIMRGSGSNMWAASDQFHFLWKKIKGDFIISATIRFIGKGTDAHRKIGIIARDKLTTDSRYADACVHGDGLTSLQYRQSDGAETEQVTLTSNNPVHIELQRTGNVFTFSAATPGENYKSASKEIALNEEVYAGLFICSHNEDITEEAVFSNVRIIIPAPKDFKPYSDYIGSHVEVMDVFTGLRKILYSASNSLQAPNWTKDGKHLIYNSEGLLYKLDLSTNTVSKLNTGFANQNNNDHVLSFDGKQLAISHHAGEKRTSTLFTLPVTGSDNPVQITSPESGHSYLHSWSPDGKKLIFTGQRKNQFDIWTVDIATKKETQLTNTPTLDDSPEYSPDGKWIYFNSARTGTMKLWRMKPDGSNPEQVTFDEYNDWFPHFSPDGKWIVYLSYPKDVSATDHPWYQKVYLRLMPASGGVPKTIAYVYGGQGTINVPSWSPDSKKIAFVSNTQYP
ncbi:TolB family protein [Terrimonas pollutisoli]|uniref:TolB family protein n=1 Tax=Terrimonas pollutisoli TaxID=3034147 RepID=UPI0023EBEB4E|nr:biopolymer transporter TolR [Terrimonas sp. H1YJ31]